MSGGKLVLMSPLCLNVPLSRRQLGRHAVPSMLRWPRTSGNPLPPRTHSRILLPYSIDSLAAIKMEQILDGLMRAVVEMRLSFCCCDGRGDEKGRMEKFEYYHWMNAKDGDKETSSLICTFTPEEKVLFYL